MLLWNRLVYKISFVKSRIIMKTNLEHKCMCYVAHLVRNSTFMSPTRSFYWRRGKRPSCCIKTSHQHFYLQINKKTRFRTLWMQSAFLTTMSYAKMRLHCLLMFFFFQRDNIYYTAIRKRSWLQPLSSSIHGMYLQNYICIQAPSLMSADNRKIHYWLRIIFCQSSKFA